MVLEVEAELVSPAPQAVRTTVAAAASARADRRWTLMADLPLFRACRGQASARVGGWMERGRREGDASGGKVAPAVEGDVGGRKVAWVQPLGARCFLKAARTRA